MQIADRICEDILGEKIPQGDRMQSVRELASSIQVNPNTIMRSYAHLTDSGIIFNKRGIGYFVAEDALQKIKDMKKVDFLSNYLPEVFRMMQLLDISFEEVKELYEKNIEN